MQHLVQRAGDGAGQKVHRAWVQQVRRHQVHGLANGPHEQLVRSRALERTNREIAERLDVAIDTIRSVLEGESS